MTSFQVLLLLAFAGLLLASIASLVRGWLSRRASLAWIGLALAASVAVVWPELTTDVARRVGIKRGADLVLYCSVVVTMLGFLMVYVRLRRLRREMTLLVRELAKARADGPGA